MSALLLAIVVGALAPLAQKVTLGAAAASPQRPSPVPPAATELGRIVFPTSGSAAAQPHFLRGVLWLHSFGYEQAVEAFREAQRLDPSFALAYWGEAMTHFRPIWYAHDVEAGRAVLRRLAATPPARAASAPTPRERAYMEALERLFGPGDVREQIVGFESAMADLASQYPDDDEAACVHALALFGRVQVLHDDAALLTKAAGIAERVFARNRAHPGAAHLIIHVYDDRDRAAKALPAARAYAAIAPASSHARHMPAHIFVQLGMWHEAAASDASAFAVSDEWVRRTRRPIADRDYHPQSWLVYEYLQLGRYRDAKRAMVPFEEAWTATNDPKFKNELATLRAYYVIETRRWTEVKGQTAFANIDELFVVALGAAQTGDLDRAEAARRVLEKIAAADQDRNRRELAAILERQIAGLIGIADGRRAAGLRALRDATALEDRSPRSVGRPHPMKPSHELLGEVLLRLNQPAEAAAMFDRALWRAANRSLSVLGLARARQKLGDTAGARAQYRQLLDNWSKADPDLPELKEARAAAAR